jgi:hypothetical protein
MSVSGSNFTFLVGKAAEAFGGIEEPRSWIIARYAVQSDNQPMIHRR